MNGMFQNTGFASLDLTGFNTSFCITMYEMFRGCTNLTTLNLSSFDTSNVDSVESMFSGDSKLKTIYVSHLWNNKKVKYSNDEFKDCTSIVGGMGTTYRPDRVDVTYAHVDRGGDPH